MDERAESVDHQSDLKATLSFNHASKLDLRIVESYFTNRTIYPIFEPKKC